MCNPRITRTAKYLHVMAVHRAVATKILSARSCLGSFLAQLWVIPKDPFSGPWGVMTVPFNPIY